MVARHRPAGNVQNAVTLYVCVTSLDSGILRLYYGSCGCRREKKRKEKKTRKAMHAILASVNSENPSSRELQGSVWL